MKYYNDEIQGIRTICDNCKEERKDLSSTSDGFMVCRSCRDKTFFVHFMGVPSLKIMKESEQFLNTHYSTVIEYLTFIRKSALFYNKPFEVMLEVFKDKEKYLSVSIYFKNRDTVSIQEHYFIITNILLEEKKQLEYPYILGVTLYDDKILLVDERSKYLKDFKWKPLYT